jgi:hypothetical protein
MKPLHHSPSGLAVPAKHEDWLVLVADVHFINPFL